MIEDVTEQLRLLLSARLDVEIDVLTKLKQMFGPATASAALGDISEKLVSKFTGAKPAKRNNPGHDLVLGEETIEVKSRDISTWDEDLMFDFGSHTKVTTTAFCIVWVWEENKPQLVQAFRLPVSVLIERWGGQQKRHCARTTLGKLRKALEGDVDPHTFVPMGQG